MLGAPDRHRNSLLSKASCGVGRAGSGGDCLRGLSNGKGPQAARKRHSRAFKNFY